MATERSLERVGAERWGIDPGRDRSSPRPEPRSADVPSRRWSGEAIAALALLSGRLIARFGARGLMTAGMACGTLGLLVLTQPEAGSSYALLAGGDSFARALYFFRDHNRGQPPTVFGKS